MPQLEGPTTEKYICVLGAFCGGEDDKKTKRKTEMNRSITKEESKFMKKIMVINN